MRIASLILGIIGSALAILIGSVSMLLALLPVPSFDEGFYFDDGSYNTASLSAEPLPDLNADSSAFWDKVDVTKFSFSCAAVLGGLLGIVGCVLVGRRNKAAGALFIVASVISVSTFYPTVLFIIAAVQALKKLQPVVPPIIPVSMLPGAYAAYPPAYPYAAAYPPPYPMAPGAYPPPPIPGAYQPPPAPDAYPPPPTLGAWPPPPSSPQPGTDMSSRQG